MECSCNSFYICMGKYFTFNIYVSINENNPQLFYWICNHLEPKLNTLGHSLCISCRHLLPGSPNSDAILKCFQKSKKFLFLEYEEFFSLKNASIWWKQEWRITWHIFGIYFENLRNTALVKYDQIRSKYIDHHQIQAFIRLVKISIRFSGGVFEEILEPLILYWVPFQTDLTW